MMHNHKTANFFIAHTIKNIDIPTFFIFPHDTFKKEVHFLKAFINLNSYLPQLSLQTHSFLKKDK